MSDAHIQNLYEKQYGLHRDGHIVCQNSIHDLKKAHRRVKNVLEAFRIFNCRAGAEVLDVGCGLGFYTHALSSTGARVTGFDFSAIGVEVAKATFPDCQFSRGTWPADIERAPKFDLVWAVDLSAINTFSITRIDQQFVKEALARLKPGGCIIVGWSTDLSGRTRGNWSNWSFDTLNQLKDVCGFSSPMVADARYSWLSGIMIWVGSRVGKSIPIFMCRRKDATTLGDLA